MRFTVRSRRILAHVLILAAAGLLVVGLLSWDRVASPAARIPVVPLVLVTTSTACAVAADQLYRRTRPQRQRRSARPIRWWWVALAFTAVLAAVCATTALLLPTLADTPPGSERTKQEIDVVRTALAAGAGVGAAITVLLAFRRQHHHEVATESTDYDASERRITELYTKAVEQLGSPQAPVRLGGLYALERLGQAAPDHRQTIVNVICAYLRMPYTVPADPNPNKKENPTKPGQKRWRLKASSSRQAARTLIHGKRDNQRRQELQVRQTAERLLTAHLCDNRPREQRDTTPPHNQFWEGMSIDLSHATLTECNFAKGHVATANFDDATFTDNARFDDATFTGHARFFDATFTDDVWFFGATFTDDASFFGATFTGHARFNDATFTGDAWFFGATFTGEASFNDATFTGHARFNDATFTGDARFNDARARTTTPEGTPVNHTWPTDWDVQPTADSWGTLRKA